MRSVAKHDGIHRGNEAMMFTFLLSGCAGRKSDLTFWIVIHEVRVEVNQGQPSFNGSAFNLENVMAASRDTGGVSRDKGRALLHSDIQDRHFLNGNRGPVFSLFSTGHLSLTGICFPKSGLLRRNSTPVQICSRIQERHWLSCSHR